MTHVLSQDATLGTLSNVSPAWFTQLVAAPLRQPITDQATARSNISALLREQSQQTVPFDWASERHHFDAGEETDHQQWEPHMGTENDSFVAGIAASDLANGGDGRHYVVAHVVDADASKKLHAFFLSNPTMKVSEFTQTPEYRMTRSYQERNARRIMARIAAAIDPSMPVAKIIDVEEDKQTYRRPGDNLRGEMMVRPAYHVVYNCFDRDNLQPSVRQQHTGRGILYRANDANIHRQSEVLKSLDPATGFVLRKCQPTQWQVEPVSKVITFDKKEDNASYMARKDSNRQALKQHVQTHYLNRQGETPSSASRPLWQTGNAAELRDDDVRLTPLVFVIHGARAVGA